MQIPDFTSRSWKDITDWEWSYLRLKGICNGCGGAGNCIRNSFIRWILKWSLSRLRLVFMEASCDIHDFTYWQGGDEARRAECDMGFFIAIMKDIERADMGRLTVIKYTTIALIFYYAVHWGGKSYFNYTEKN